MSPRKRKRKHVGSAVDVTPGGKLRLRFRAQLPGKGLHRFGETTELEDTPENRRRLEALAALIGAEIRTGAFDYLKRFPNGSKADAFRAWRAGPSAVPGIAPTVDGYYRAWIGWKRAERVRKSRVRDYEQHFRAYILPAFGRVRLDEIGLPHLRDLQLGLRRKDLSEKTIRNVILGSLKAMLRDARRDAYAAPWPFRDLDWEETIEEDPDPFTEQERDRLLGHFLTRRWKVGGFNVSRLHYDYYALLHTLFFTGCRPSELTALRIGDVDLQRATVRIRRSRHLGTESAPKTRSAVRTVRLTESNVSVLERLLRHDAAPDDYVFRNVHGRPVDQSNFAELFREAQRGLGIRPRKLYATKHAYVSLALTRGVNVTWLSEQTGVALATLLKHYGRFMHTYDADRIELDKIEGKKGRFGPPIAHGAEEIYVSSRNLAHSEASPTEFEPVLPA